MSKTEQHFSELDLETLKSIAQEQWAPKFAPYLLKIIIFKYNFPEDYGYFGSGDLDRYFKDDLKYAIAFEALRNKDKGAKECFERLENACANDFGVSNGFSQAYSQSPVGPIPQRFVFIPVPADAVAEVNAKFPGILNDTGVNLWISDNQSSKFVTTPEYWEKIIRKAHGNGFVNDTELSGLLSLDPQYCKNLPELWELFGLSVSIPDITVSDGRVRAWWYLITKWTTGSITGADPYGGYPNKVKPQLPHKDGNPPGMIDLEDLKAFFIRWEIPLPGSLFDVKRPQSAAKSATKDGVSDKQVPKNIDMPTPSSSALGELGKAGAKKRWDKHNDLMEKALQLADEKWASGDDAFHNEMAEYIVGKPEFKTFGKDTVKKKLIPVADKYGRTRGKKGVTRKK